MGVIEGRSEDGGQVAEQELRRLARGAAWLCGGRRPLTKAKHDAALERRAGFRKRLARPRVTLVVTSTEYLTGSVVI